eukprot:CAMPEP_0177657256 /NCGR_PEP_ID=MMETSP0447-20121125/16079_1 /TAXON_ID=0 /ORGANISM="Stygamoeba regulata, Strain BSH-02190019" /LENGTH=486 /DNA_ID=CAMNT_0019161581 /DNA_START=69 /DNA_END=1529 /DNA_ORIENTATION=+
MADHEQQDPQKEQLVRTIAKAETKVKADAKKEKNSKPGNPVSGIVRGAGYMVGGVAAGVGVLLVGTVGGLVMGTVGRKPSMLVAGPAVGVAGAIALPAAGIGMGIKRAGQGFINTPSTIKQAVKGKEVEDDPTEDEVFNAAQEFLAGQVSGALPTCSDEPAAAAAAIAHEAALPPPVDTTLYEVLGLSSDSTPSQIKRAYYTQAREWHPDRNQAAEATERFQKIGEAYQVLSDPERRLRYHKRGLDSVDQTELVGADLLFSLMFGNGKFSHMVGELLVQRTAATGAAPAPAVLKEQQAHRIEQLATKLIARVEPWVSGGDEGAAAVRAGAEDEVRRLRKSPFGVDLFHCIGYVYVNKGQALLKKTTSVLPVAAFFSTLSEKGHMWRQQGKVRNAAMKEMMAQSMKAAREGHTEEHAAEDDPEMLVSQIGLLWLTTVVDIEHTLRLVLTKVIQDEEVPKATRVKRAEAIVAIGQVFLEAEHKRFSQE